MLLVIVMVHRVGCYSGERERGERRETLGGDTQRDTHAHTHTHNDS
jgi:hypothetical protein